LIFSTPSPTPNSYTLSYTTLFRSNRIRSNYSHAPRLLARRWRNAAARGIVPNLIFPYRCSVAAALRAANNGGTDASSCRRNHRRSEEHTSELQSRGQLVCRLLLEK